MYSPATPAGSASSRSRCTGTSSRPCALKRSIASRANGSSGGPQATASLSPAAAGSGASSRRGRAGRNPRRAAAASSPARSRYVAASRHSAASPPLTGCGPICLSAPETPGPYCRANCSLSCGGTQPSTGSPAVSSMRPRSPSARPRSSPPTTTTPASSRPRTSRLSPQAHAPTVTPRSRASMTSTSGASSARATSKGRDPLTPSQRSSAGSTATTAMRSAPEAQKSYSSPAATSSSSAGSRTRGVRVGAPQRSRHRGRSAPRAQGGAARSSANAASRAPTTSATAGPGSRPHSTSRGADMTGVLLWAGGLPQTAAVGRPGGDSGAGDRIPSPALQEEDRPTAWTCANNSTTPCGCACCSRSRCSPASSGCRWDHHGFVAGEALVGVGLVALVNLPMYIVERRRQVRTAAAVIVVTDLALVTVALVFAGGALSPGHLLRVADRVLRGVPAGLGSLRRGRRRQRPVRRRLGAAARRLALGLGARG